MKLLHFFSTVKRHILWPEYSWFKSRLKTENGEATLEHRKINKKQVLTVLVAMLRHTAVSLLFFYWGVCVCVYSVTQNCPSLCASLDCSPPGFSVHGILQQEYWSGLPFPPPGIFPTQGLKPHLLYPLHRQLYSLPVCTLLWFLILPITALPLPAYMYRVFVNLECSWIFLPSQ